VPDMFFVILVDLWCCFKCAKYVNSFSHICGKSNVNLVSCVPFHACFNIKSYGTY
jgi:fatty-acid desaturase